MANGSESASTNGGAPEAEVTAKAKRRRFTAEYKLRILREADALAETGGIGEMLRREGLDSSHLTTWRQARERGELDGLTPKTRGRKPNPDKALLDENRRLERENARLAKKLAQAEAIIEMQEKWLRCWQSRTRRRTAGASRERRRRAPRRGAAQATV